MRASARPLSGFTITSGDGSMAGRGCQWGGCERDGLYRAPRSRRELHRYWWFCLEHVREYNAAWNYYAGMSDNEVEADIRFDTVWQRPSWRLGVANPGCAWRTARFHDGFETFDAYSSAPPAAPATAEMQALVILELRPPVTVAIVKARYKELVKRHHPDCNGGDKAAEERFKLISEAYRTVMSSIQL